MDNMHSQLKRFIDELPDIKSIEIKYNNENYVVVSMRCLDEDSGRLKGSSKAFRYEDLSYFSENEYSDFMYILSMMYNECRCVE